MAIVTRAGKGSALTIAEMDANFTYLDTKTVPVAQGGTGHITGAVGNDNGAFSIGSFVILIDSSNTAHASGTLVAHTNLVYFDDGAVPTTIPAPTGNYRVICGTGASYRNLYQRVS